jgi:hypothetical protein
VRPFNWDFVQTRGREVPWAVRKLMCVPAAGWCSATIGAGCSIHRYAGGSASLLVIAHLDSLVVDDRYAWLSGDRVVLRE